MLEFCCRFVGLLVLLSPGPGLGEQAPPPVLAEGEDEAGRESDGGEERIARTREERRQGGLELDLGDWLTVSGVAELEALSQRFSLADASTNAGTDFSTTLELGLELKPLSWAKLELLYEYDGDSRLDEAIVAFEAGDFELEMGRLYVPFGEYFSHFISGPSLEFGETRSSGVVLTYTPVERLILSGFLHDGRAQKVDSGGLDLEGGLAVEGSPFGPVTFTLSFMSDLADSNERLLGDGDQQKRVPGLSASAVFSHGRFEATGELVLALGSFRELDPHMDKLRAWNVELAFYPQEALELALRLEGSQDLQDATRLQGGVAAAWRVMKHAYLRVEYLHGAFEPGLALGSDDLGLDKVHQIGAQISIQ